MLNRLLTLNQNRKALKLTKQLRLDFSDYSAAQQERDAQRSLLRTVFLLKIDGEWGHLFITQRGDDVQFYPGKELVEVYKELKETYPKCLPRVIQNKHLADYMRTMKPKVKKPKAKELMIEWQGLKQER